MGFERMKEREFIALRPERKIDFLKSAIKKSFLIISLFYVFVHRSFVFMCIIHEMFGFSEFSLNSFQSFWSFKEFFKCWSDKMLWAAARMFHDSALHLLIISEFANRQQPHCFYKSFNKFPRHQSRKNLFVVFWVFKKFVKRKVVQCLAFENKSAPNGFNGRLSSFEKLFWLKLEAFFDWLSYLKGKAL